MRIHTSATYRDICSCLPRGVSAYITEHGSRSRERAFEVTLYAYAKDDLHRRYGNTGGYGRSDDVAATWDEWGLFMVALYEIDPEWTCTYYPTEADFYDRTRRHREYVRLANKPESLAARTHTAPWLD
jgi:hypothetical protein